MSYKDYMKAAFRHLAVCNQLIDDIKRCQLSIPNQKHILNEVYYISGYVVECVLSYVLFYKHNGDISTNPFYNDPAFKKHHNLQFRLDYVKKKTNSRFTNIVFFSIPHEKPDQNRLFSDWSVDFRYEESTNLSKDHLSLFLSEITEIHKKILFQYPL